ncbi:MAG TPA: hypothetical protein VGH32_13145, partial [Pirellulales bacterium]
RLTRLESPSQFLLREIDSLPLIADGQGNLDTSVEKLTLIVAHLEKVGGVSESPTSRFEHFSLLDIH